MDFRNTGLSPELFQPFERLLRDPRTDYIHAHYAKPGCFAARIDRV